MANTTITNLPSLATFTDASVLATDSGGTTQKVSGSTLRTYILANVATSNLQQVTDEGSTTTNSITAAGFVGDVTGSVSGTAATVTTAAQPNITTVGTLTSLSVNGNIDIETGAVSVATISGEDDGTNTTFTLQASDSSVADASSGAITLSSGDYSGANGSAGAINLIGGVVSGDFAFGGNIGLYGGNGSGGANTIGGSVVIRGGDATGPFGSGGDITIKPGLNNGEGQSGQLEIEGSDSVNGSPSGVLINGGQYTGSNTTIQGGNVIITSGSRSSTGDATTARSQVLIQGVTQTFGTGGNVRIVSGYTLGGGPTVKSGTVQIAGAVTVQAGGEAGDVEISGGQALSANTSTVPGSVTITAGLGYDGGVGPSGNVNIGTANTTAVNINNLTTSGTTTVGSVSYTPTAFGNLPASPSVGTRLLCNDSNLTPVGNYAEVISGGGGNLTFVYYDGTNYRIG